MPATRGQVTELIARFAAKVNWDKLESDKLQKQVIDLQPDELGRRFTEFLQNGCWSNFGEPKSFQTKPFDPAEFFGNKWSIWKGPVGGAGLSGEEDIDSRSPTGEIDVSKIIFETCLNGGEASVKGEEKLLRLKAKKDFIRFGAGIFAGLRSDYQANKENSGLEFLYHSQEIRYLDFFGIILRNPNGNRCVPYLYRNDDGEWFWLCNWLVNDWDARRLSAGRAS
jgi:hypothetical protein